MDRIAIADASREAHRLGTLDDLEIHDAGAVEDSKIGRLFEGVAQSFEAGTRDVGEDLRATYVHWQECRTEDVGRRFANALDVLACLECPEVSEHRALGKTDVGSDVHQRHSGRVLAKQVKDVADPLGCSDRV